ncbi:MAG TPA: alpha/beta hydrolase [Ignavibacteriaceae bacterium]|nr:alpha/beta hydrolase [Ignavibacteriaceae bacterium]
MNIKKNEISIHFEGDDEKIPIVFIHGFPFDHHMWNNQITCFNENYFCVTYDVRGLGDSVPGDGQYTIELFVDDLEMIIDELKLKKPIICGFSMGGYIALRAVEKIEEKFSGLILCDTRSGADSNEGKINRAIGIQKINLNGVKSYVNEFIQNCFCEKSRKNKRELVGEMISRSEYFSSSGIKGCLLAMAARTDTTNYLTKLQLPVLILCGEEDKLTTPTVMMEMKNKISNSEFYTIPDAGHLSPVENPWAVNEHIDKFLKKIKL